MRIFHSLIVFVLCMGVIACTPKKSSQQDNLLSVSILPQKYFIERIAGNDFQVNVLIPPGASPASYEPTPRQMQQVSKSVAYFKMGNLPFENTWMQNLMEGNKDLKLYNLSRNIDLIQGEMVEHGDHHHEGGIDPHVWSSPKSAMIIAQNVYDFLSELTPEKKEIYKQRLDQFMTELTSLDEKAGQLNAGNSHSAFMIFHPALSYLARDYGWEQIAIEMDGKEPSPAHLKELIEEAREHQIRLVFIQKQFNKENAATIANEIGAKLVQIDPLSEDWLGEMNRILENLKMNQANN